MPESLPVAEDHPQHPINPYGRSKWMVEQLLAEPKLDRKLEVLLERCTCPDDGTQAVAQLLDKEETRAR